MSLILAVEDDATQRLILELELEPIAQRVGARFLSAASIAEARSMMADAPPDVLLITDAHLPDGEGANFIREVERDGVMAVLVTASVGPLNIEGIRAYEKPMELDAQRTFLEGLVAEWRGGDSLAAGDFVVAAGL